MAKDMNTSQYKHITETWTTKIYIKKCSNLLLVNETHIKTIKIPDSSIRMTKIKELDETA